MITSSHTDGRVGTGLGSVPILLLLGALFVAVVWWIEPCRYRVMEQSVQLHPAVAERALFDESERIVMLGCNQFHEGDRAILADRWLRSRPKLERQCVSDVYRGPSDP